GAGVTGGLGQLVLVVVDQSDVGAVSQWIGIITFAGFGFALAFFTMALVHRQDAGGFHLRMPGAVAHAVVGKDLVVRGGVQRVVGVRQPVEVVVVEAVEPLLAGDPLDVVFPVEFVERTGYVVVGRVFQDAFFHLQEVVVAQGDLRAAGQQQGLWHQPLEVAPGELALAGDMHRRELVVLVVVVGVGDPFGIGVGVFQPVRVVGVRI